jgi:hypothetical protein
LPFTATELEIAVSNSYMELLLAESQQNALKDNGSGAVRPDLGSPNPRPFRHLVPVNTHTIPM